MFTLIAMGVGAAYFYSLVAVLFPHLFPASMTMFVEFINLRRQSGEETEMGRLIVKGRNPGRNPQILEALTDDQIILALGKLHASIGHRDKSASFTLDAATVQKGQLNYRMVREDYFNLS